MVPAGDRVITDAAYQFLNPGETQGAAYVWELRIVADARTCTPFDVHTCLSGDLMASEISQTPVDYIIPGEWNYASIDGYELDAGIYVLADNFRFTDNPNVVFSYDFNLTVVPVPVPVAAWLFTSGLAVLVGMARRGAASRSM